MSANAVAAGVPLLLMPLLTRILSQEDYGRVGMFSVTIVALSALAGLSVYGATGIRYFERNELNFPNYVTSCFAILGASSAVLMLVVLLFSDRLEQVTHLPTSWLVIATLVAMVQFVLQVRLGIWQSAKQPWHFGALRISQSVGDAALTLALVVGLGLAWQGRAAGMAIAAGGVGALAVISLFRSGLIGRQVKKDYVLNALRYGVPLIPHVLGGMLLAMADRFMISSMLGVAETGIYFVSVQIGLAIRLITESVNRAYAPWLIEALRINDYPRDIAAVRMTYAYSTALLAGAILVGWLAPFILPLLVGEAFQAAAPIVGVTALGFAFGGMYLMVTNYLFYAGQTGRLALITISCGALNVGLSYVLLPLNGAIGAAQAFAASQLALFLLTWFAAQRARPMPWLRALTGQG
ncbi:lipopolysaccharide biosynthesis protein [Devosia ginsengisoli]|nr:oligosaccharide flippase family protein [Devosia ginsengisoli]